ncbi:MAG TPA: hypothetical protein P5057_09450, partial [Acidobacteriota bacterium]|nr:hypothetical protein [Acidobacteriota bacterium]
MTESTPPANSPRSPVASPEEELSPDRHDDPVGSLEIEESTTTSDEAEEIGWGGGPPSEPPS